MNFQVADLYSRLLIPQSYCRCEGAATKVTIAATQSHQVATSIGVWSCFA